MNYNTLLPVLNKAQSMYLGKYPHKYVAYDLSLPQNKELKELLVSNNFFDFFCSNHQKIVYKHQVVAFFCCGGKEAHSNGFKSLSSLSYSRIQTYSFPDDSVVASYEVHHIDGNTFNNHPSNLLFLPTQVHQIVTRGQRRIYKYLKVFGKKLPTDFLDSIRPFNRKGKPVNRIYHWITSILSISILRTARFLNISISIKGLFKFAKSVLINFKYKLDPSFTRSFFLPLLPSI